MKKVKRLKLREEVKLLLMAVVMVAVLIAGIVMLDARNEAIDSGEIVVVDESYMDR